MGAHQVAVAKVDAGRHDGASDHTLGLAEIILIVGAATSTIGIDQRGLATATRPATPLSIIRRGRGNVP